jgi:Holliday junction resolvasome RuvABC endonuclease subunit
LQASGVAIAHWPSKQTVFVKLPKFRKADSTEARNKRLVALVEIAHEVPHFKEADVVYVERAYGASRNSQSTLMQLLGAFVGGLAANGIRCEEINTSTWKAVALKNGRADKDAVMKWAVEVTGRDFKTQDEADALCIAYAGYIKETST